MKKVLILSLIFLLAGNIKETRATSGPVTGEKNRYLRIRLSKDAINADETLIFFKANTVAAYDPKIDVIYFPGNGQVNLSSLSSDNIPLAYNVQPMPAASSIIKLNINTKDDGAFQLIMKEIINVPKLFDIWLIDAYKNDSLDMRNNSTYSFNVLKSDAKSFGAKRFSIVIRQNPAYAYHLLYFTADKVINVKQVEVAWQTENEEDYTKFTIERSVDNGDNFKLIDSLPSTGVGAYKFSDKTPIVGANYYRLKQQNFNKEITFSSAVKVICDDPERGNVDVITAGPTIYPNPASDVVNVVVNYRGQGTALYDIIITNINGLSVKQATNTQAHWQGSINELKPGIYFVTVVNNKDKSFAGNNRFVKQ